MKKIPLILFIVAVWGALMSFTSTEPHPSKGYKSPFPGLKLARPFIWRPSTYFVSGYVTRDTVINSLQCRITYVAGKTDSTNIIVHISGALEVGSDPAKARVYGPHYWFDHGWDGGVELGNGIHYPVYVTIVPAAAYWPPAFLKGTVDILLSRFKVRYGGLNVMGLSAGGWSWESFFYYEPTLHDHSYQQYIRSFVNMQGVRVDDNLGSDPYSYPHYLGHAAKNNPNFHWLAFEQVNDSRSKDQETKNMIDSVGSNSGRFAFLYTTFGSGLHTNFNDQCSPFQTNWTLSNANVRTNNGGVINSIGIPQGWSIYQWMLRQDADTSLQGVNNNPSANAGSTQNIDYPAATQVTLSGSASDADGTIASHVWTKVSGPAGSTITAPSNYTTTVTGLVPGQYVFNLEATDNLGAKGSANVTINVNNTLGNAPPIVDAGAYQEVTLPNGSVSLSANATDDSGAVARVKWSTLKAPGQATLTGVIIGSSTSTCVTVGGGSTGDSCYIKIIRDYFRNIGAVDTIYNLAQSSTTVFEGMQTGYTPPGGYPSPDPSINITAAIAKPGVDFVIVNYPTNGFDYMTVTNVLKAFRDMRAYGEANGVKVFFTTTQQRTSFSPSEQARLKELADSMLIQHPNNIIQRWYGFNEEGTLNYRVDYGYDRIHGNGKSQIQMAKNVIAFNPLKDLVSTSHTITSPNSATTTVTGLSAGTYLFLVGVQDNDSLWNYDTVSVTVNPANTSCNGASPVTYTLTPTNGNEIYITNASGRGWKGGDTLKIPAGNYNVIEIDSFGGDPCRDIIIINSGGQVIVDGPMRFGKDVHHVKILGTGSADTYGFKTVSFASGRVNHFTVKRIEAGPNPIGVGFYMKQDPYDNEPWTHYPNYTMTKITVDSCYVHDVSGEGMYIGSTAPDGDPYQGNRIPQRLDSVTISNNIVINTGWDGIQLSNARNGALIFGNTVTNFGLLDIDGQRAGIISGGNTNSDVYDNIVTNGTGNGIQFFGYGELECYGNTITNVGNTAKNINGEESIYGQDYVNGVELNPKQLMNIHDNQINYPKALGAIRFNQSTNSDPTLLVNNNFCFTVSPPVNWQSLYIFLQAGFTNTNNILACEPGANQAPTAMAGDDIPVQLPVSSTILNGSGSDPDGTIQAYKWEQISGPNAVIASPNTATTGISELTTTGVREFRFTVTDNGGVSAFDIVKVTVIAQVNQVPKVFASSPTPVITLPTNVVLLEGSSSFDPDGTITSYLWERVAGPEVSFLNASSSNTSVSGLIQGVYKFRLTVRDNNNASVSADVTITVNASPDPGAPTLGQRKFINLRRTKPSE